jgi:hypothetical protein
VKGDVATQMTLKRSATASFTTVLVIGNKTMLAGNQTVLLWIGRSQADVDGKKTPIDAANAAIVPETLTGRAFVAPRFVGESTGLDVSWNADARSVTAWRAEEQQQPRSYEARQRCMSQACFDS